MGEEKDSSGLIWGIIIGAIIALALLSRNNQQILSQSANNHQQQPQKSEQSQQPVWKPMDIPRVDDIKPQTVQPHIIQVQQDPKIIEMVSQLQKTSSQLEQTTSKLQELQESVLKLQQNNIYQQPQTTIQPETIYQLEQTTSKLQETVSKLEKDQQTNQISINSNIQTDQIPINVQQIEQIQRTEQTQQIYKNSEKWAIKRGSNGRIKSLEIARDVEKKN